MIIKNYYINFEFISTICDVDLFYTAGVNPRPTVFVKT